MNINGHPATAHQASFKILAEEFFKSLGAAAKLFVLYPAKHPICVEGLAKVNQELKELLDSSPDGSIILAWMNQRWLVHNGDVVELARAPEAIETLFRFLGLETLSFHAGIEARELAGFCALASMPPGRLAELDPETCLEKYGLSHIKAARRALEKISAPGAPGGETRSGPKRAPGESGLPQTSEKAQVSPPPVALKTPDEPKRDPLDLFIDNLTGKISGDPGERSRLREQARHLLEQAVARQAEEKIQELKQDNKRLKNEYLRTAGVLSRVADGTVVVDKNGHVLAMNPAAEELFGKRLAELAGKPINYGVNPDEHLVVLASDIEAALDSTAPENIQVMSRDSIEQTIRRSMALVHNETGNVVGTYMALPWTNQVKEALNRQEQFVARMTHELKAPLSSINSALELLDETVGPQLKPEERQFLSISIKNSRRLQSLIGEILNFSKLKSGAMSIAPKAVAVAPMIREALDALGPWARSKGVDLKGEAAQEDLAVFADPSRSVQVLTNLMSNAIKHTPAGGPVLVGAGKGQGEHIGSVVFYVQDSGPGIPKDDLDKIFKEFVQLGDGRGDGVGLGLAIAKELVERQKGEIWITSEEGKGSIFYFSLPSVAQEEPRNRAEPSWNEQLFQILSTHYRGS